MHKIIVVNGQEYELQITARKVINNGGTAVSMDETETDMLITGIEEDMRSAIGAVIYAAEQRNYEASFERDKEVYKSMKNGAREWDELADRLIALVDGE